MTGAVLLDVDGTLVDSNYQQVAAWVRAFHDQGIEVDGWTVHRSLGQAGPELIQRVTESRRLRVPDDVADLVAQGHSRYAEQSTDVDRSKPAPDLVHVALDAAGVQPEDAVFVGDSVWDVLAAGRAGIPCVAVLSGGIGSSELSEAGAVEIYDDVAAILENLGRSALARAWTA